MMSDLNTEAQGVRPHLSLWDSVSIIVGIVIGAGIYETAPMIFSTVTSPWMAMAAWGLGGALSLAGALCYAELASTYPRSGGDYVYLSLAYGPWVGFLFGWAQLAVILTGSIGMMAYIFADYSVAFWKLGAEATFPLAAGAVVLLSAMNIFGVALGKRTQNIFTLIKILGLLLIVVAGFSAIPEDFDFTARFSSAGASQEFKWSSIGLAMVFVLYTYGGWNDAAFVASELKDRQRNIPIALVCGTLLITFIYLMVNAAYLLGLGYQGAQNSKAIAADLLQWPLGSAGSGIMSLLVMVSALGAVNGLIYTGSRLYSVLGADHRLFAHLGRWNPRFKTPLVSIAAQAIVTVGLMAIVGTSAGRFGVDTALSWVGLNAPEWQGHGGFDTLLRCTAPVFWLFFLLAGVSLFILRFRDPRERRPFSVPLYPYIPLIFCMTSVYMLYRSIDYARGLTLVGAGLLALGLPLYLISGGLAKKRPTVLNRNKELMSMEVKA